MNLRRRDTCLEPCFPNHRRSVSEFVDTKSSSAGVEPNSADTKLTTVTVDSTSVAAVFIYCTIESTSAALNRALTLHCRA
jgi:hypothetical protein